MAADRVTNLRADFDRLGELLASAEGSGAAAIVRERRILGELLDQLAVPERVSKVDELADRRGSKTADSGASARRRKSG